MLVYVVLAPVGGAIAGRFPRRQLMITLDVARAVVMAGLAIVVAADGPPLLATAIVLVGSALTTPYRPALAAATPYVVPESLLAAANGAEATVGQLMWFAGPALATLILTIGSASIAMAVNAATFVVAALFVAASGDLGGERRTSTSGADGPRPAGILAGVAEGWQALVRVPGLFMLNALIVATIFAFGAESILHVIAAEDRLGRGAEFVGALTAAIGVGGLIVAPLAGRIAGCSRPGPWLVACAVLQGAPLVAIGFISTPIVALIVLAIEGVGVILFEVLAITLLQRLAGERISQVFGIQDSMSAGAQLLGAIAAPLLVAGPGLTTACAASGGALVVFGIAGAPQLLRTGRLAAASGADLAPVVDELLALDLLAGASRPAVEAVAAAVTPELVETGSVIVEEGHDADDLFVIRAGTFSAATRAGGTLRLMSAGDWFGEIGVLGRRPRSATVVAESAGELLRIPGPAFLAAIEEMTAVPDPLYRSMHARLALSSFSARAGARQEDRGLRDVPAAG
jgi:MFS family permease